MYFGTCWYIWLRFGGPRVGPGWLKEQVLDLRNGWSATSSGVITPAQVWPQVRDSRCERLSAPARSQKRRCFAAARMREEPGGAGAEAYPQMRMRICAWETAYAEMGWKPWIAEAMGDPQKRDRKCGQVIRKNENWVEHKGSNLVISSFTFGIFGDRFLGDFEESSSCNTR